MFWARPVTQEQQKLGDSSTIAHQKTKPNFIIWGVTFVNSYSVITNRIFLDLMSSAKIVSSDVGGFCDLSLFFQEKSMSAQGPTQLGPIQERTQGEFL